jgi:tetratricopeptide (TPR) repeat protein
MTRHLAVLLLGLTSPAFAAPLQIASNPPGASVFLDDRFVGATPVSVDPGTQGKHLLLLEKRGYEPYRQVVDVRAEPVQVTAELRPAVQGRLTVTTAPAGAEVYVDGRLCGKSPLTADGLDLGPHNVQAAKAGYDPQTQPVVLSREQPKAEVSLTLAARIEDYLVAQVAAHPDDVMSITDLAHEYALQHRFDECLATLGQAFDAVGTYGEALDQDAIRRVYMEIDRLYEKQFDYAPDDVVATLRPRLIEALRAAIERFPRSGYNYEALADLYTQAGTPEKALQVQQTGAATADGLAVRLRLLGDAGSAIYQTGAQAEKAQNWQAAAQSYEAVVKTYPQLWCSANALSRLVDVYAEGLKDTPKAVDAARRLVAGFPRDDACVTALSRAARYLSDAGDAEQAVALAEQVGEQYPGSLYAPNVLLRAAKTCEQPLRQPDRALALLRRLIEISGPLEEGAQARQEVATLLTAQGDQAGAQAMIQEIMTQYPLSVQALQAETDPTKRAHSRDASRAYQQASAAAKDATPDKAVAALQPVVDAYSDTYFGCIAQQLIISAWVKAQDYPKAVAASEQFAERWPNHPDTPQQLYRAASLLASSMGDPDRALAMYERLQGTYPQSYYGMASLYQLGQLRMQTSQVIDYEKAREVFLQLVQRHPESEYAPMARKYAADCLMQLREPETAREAYLQMMTEDPNSYVASLAARMYQTVRMRKEEPPQS